jgi:hypothetical protein
VGYSPSESTVYVVRGDQTIEKFPVFLRTSIIVGYGRSFLFCLDSCSICQCSFGRKRREVTAICYIDKEIVCMAASRRFVILAFASGDGAISIYDVDKRALLTRYESNREILQVLVTQGWGFVVALSKEELFVFSVNGEIIRKHTLQVPIVKLFTHSNCAEFDFLSFQTTNREIGVFDAFYPGTPVIFAKMPAEVVNISYIAGYGLFLVILTDGTVKLQPHSIECC